MSDTDAERIAAELSANEAMILDKIATGQPLTFATRAQDAYRQRMRRMGLIHVVRNPRRWEVLPLGIRVRSALRPNDGTGEPQ